MSHGACAEASNASMQGPDHVTVICESSDKIEDDFENWMYFKTLGGNVSVGENEIPCFEIIRDQNTETTDNEKMDPLGQGQSMSRRMETRKQSRRAASKEALKQMQLLSAIDDEDSTETYEIPSDDDVVEVEAPPKKKYRLSHRKSADGNDRDVLVLKSVTSALECLELEAYSEELSESQRLKHEKVDNELQQMNDLIDRLVKQSGAQVVYTGESCTAIQLSQSLASTTADDVSPPAPATPQVILQAQKSSATTSSYQLVMDPRLGVIVGTMTPAPGTTLATTQLQQPQPSTVPAAQASQITALHTRRRRGKNSPVLPPSTTQTTPLVQKQTRQTKSLTSTPPPLALRPVETTSVGGLTSNRRIVTNNIVDLTADEGKSTADTKEISFNKLQGKTFPSLVVVARPHLRVKDSSSSDRSRLDAKVKAVLMHPATKFTEWLIQQGLVRSEQTCPTHPTSKLKLGMYSDVTKFPYSGGYVWISECCPTRFVSVFSGSLFEGSPHQPSVILKLIYHWACQTNVQNVVQWVKVDNLYVKGLNTWLRAACTVALHTHIGPLGGPGRRVEVGVISLGTTSQDGHQRQVKVEVLGLLETENKFLRLRAVEPSTDGDRNYKKRFSKILEPILTWVHPESIIVTDLTVDKGTLHNMGFKQVLQSTSNSPTNSNQTIMEYLRRIVPRMFQNTLSLLSRQIIQQFLDELVWREWFGTTAVQAFDNIVIHLSEQTRCDTGQGLIMRLNKVAANPFKNWSINQNHNAAAPGNTSKGNKAVVTEQPAPKRVYGRQKAKVTNVVPPKASSPTPEVSRPLKSLSPDIPEQMVPLENYYYGTIPGSKVANKVSLNIKCSMCRSLFTNNIKLMLHLFSHVHSVMPGAQQCRYCLTSATTVEGLNRHIVASHPSETRFGDAYACVICESRFQNPYSLGKHLSREHFPAELPYACGTCGLRCSSHKQVIDHFYKEHDGSSNIQCPFCLKSTTVCSNGRMMPQNINFFLQHLQKHQKKAMARRCNRCVLWFIQKEYLREHVLRMHDSQRHKEGLIPWAVPKNGRIMVPKSKQDHQPAEEEDINYANLQINAPSTAICKECKKSLLTMKHFPSLQSCPHSNCQYSTSCSAALVAHKARCTNLKAALPVQPLPFEMFCVCGYSDKDGFTLARHLAICERKSAYPSEEKAKAAIITHSMLDVLGLMRRPEEPPAEKDEEPSLLEEKDTVVGTRNGDVVAGCNRDVSSDTETDLNKEKEQDSASKEMEEQTKDKMDVHQPMQDAANEEEKVPESAAAENTSEDAQESGSYNEAMEVEEQAAEPTEEAQTAQQAEDVQTAQPTEQAAVKSALDGVSEADEQTLQPEEDKMECVEADAAKTAQLVENAETVQPVEDAQATTESVLNVDTVIEKQVCGDSESVADEMMES